MFWAAFSLVTPEKEAERVAPLALFSAEPVVTLAVRFPSPEVPPPDESQLLPRAVIEIPFTYIVLVVQLTTKLTLPEILDTSKE